MDYRVVKKILDENYALVARIASLPFLKNVPLSIKAGIQEARAESIEAETDNGRIILYKDIFEKLYGRGNKRALIQTISHEFWHLFSARFRFYHKLEQVYLGRMNLGQLQQRDVRDFIKRINSMSKEKIEKCIKEFQKTTPCWTDKYILEQAGYDSSKPFIARIRHFKFRGVVEDMFAEAYACFLSGIRNPYVPDSFSELSGKLMGFSQNLSRLAFPIAYRP